jgi:predicted lysophospholipase L1 biosynthesis ABC-type transport system permease subunit
MRVIGIAADVKHRGLNERPEPYLYLPMEGTTFQSPVTVVVATAGSPDSLLAGVRERVRAVEPELPIRTLETMTQRLDDRARRGEAMIARFFATCGSLALFLSAIGLGGSVWYSVEQRRREFGVRAAIGAEPGMLTRLVIRDGLSLAVPGIAVGLLAGAALMRGIGSIISGIDTTSPVPYFLTAVLQFAIVFAASALPGRRAGRANPLAILRAD